MVWLERRFAKANDVGARELRCRFFLHFMMAGGIESVFMLKKQFVIGYLILWFKICFRVIDECFFTSVVPECCYPLFS